MKIMCGGYEIKAEKGVNIYDSLHGFWEGREIETATFDSKMSQQLIRLVKEPLFWVFMDVHKAYGSLDKDR